MFHLRKTTLFGLILLLAGSVAVVLANPEQRALRSYNARLEALKSQLNFVKNSEADPLQMLDQSDREAVDSLEEFLQTYRAPNMYRFGTMKELAILVLSTEPVVNYLSMAARTALPAPKGELPSSEAAVQPSSPAVTPPASAPPKATFRIGQDEGC
ncbi:MAG: hypothetical protein HY788_20000 [Deltaproteobacteria bacterium]|nr:hypothetical protein [Deltaproteobacteria bacterium]